MAIVAGSDSTATSLCGVFYYLLTNPSAREKLQAEIDETFPPLEGNPLSSLTLANMPYLNAVMYVLFTIYQLMLTFYSIK